MIDIIKVGLPLFIAAFICGGLLTYYRDTLFPIRFRKAPTRPPNPARILYYYDNGLIYSLGGEDAKLYNKLIFDAIYLKDNRRRNELSKHKFNWQVTSMPVSNSDELYPFSNN